MWTSSLAEEVMPPAAEATVVFGLDVDGQANKEKPDAFKGSYIELHKLKG